MEKRNCREQTAEQQTHVFSFFKKPFFQGLTGLTLLTKSRTVPFNSEHMHREHRAAAEHGRDAQVCFTSRLIP